MFDISWSELFLFIIVAVIAIGPKQLPSVMYGFGRIIRRMQYMRFAMSQQFEDFMAQHDLNQIRNAKNPVSDSALFGDDEDDILERKLNSEKDGTNT